MLARVIWAVTVLFTAVSNPAPAELHDERFSAAGHYVFVDDDGSLSIWQETNGLGGLQTRAHWYDDVQLQPDLRVIL